VEIRRDKITDPLEILETFKYSNGKEITTLEKYWPQERTEEQTSSKIKEELPEKELWSEDGAWSLISYYAFPRFDNRGYLLVKRGGGYESSNHYFEVSMYIEGECRFSIDPNEYVTKGNPHSFYWSKDTSRFAILGDYGFYDVDYYDDEGKAPPTFFFFDANNGNFLKEVCLDSAREGFEAYTNDSLIQIEFE
jgi:uncharacterized protein with WD repeat